ncbi:MAG: hypothetical protein A2284_17465 [Deltaproteobacteria bacterium RIFOXYA12_FULL_61_11]|nr:MAG: hypothetical protein A2284_17465 [Deltaproteobacteria bacterium RIFOXYA12_FULL_61_11]
MASTNLSQGQQDHTTLLNHLRYTDLAIDGQDFEELYRRFQTMSSFFTNDLERHFDLEERLLFPAALFKTDNLEVIRLVLSLQADHAVLQLQAAYLVRQAEKGWEDMDDGAVADFFLLLSSHVRKEASLLYPWLEERDEVIEHVVSRS